MCEDTSENISPCVAMKISESKSATSDFFESDLNISISGLSCNGIGLTEYCNEPNSNDGNLIFEIDGASLNKIQRE